jgi:hypothetical protein
MYRAILATAVLGGLLEQLSAQQAWGPAVPQSITIEVEGLVASSAATAGSVTAQSMTRFGSGWSGGAQLLWTPPGPGAQLRLRLSSQARGRNEVMLHFTKAPDYGFLRASFDGGRAVGFNGFSRTVSQDSVLLGAFDLAPGTHEILIEVAMKDGGSTGYFGGVDRITLSPVGPSTGGAPLPPAAGAATVAQALMARNAGAASAGSRVPFLRLQGTSPRPLDRSAGPGWPAAAADPLNAAEKAAIATASVGEPGKATPLSAGSGFNAGKPVRLTAFAPHAPSGETLGYFNGTLPSVYGLGLPGLGDPGLIVFQLGTNGTEQPNAAFWVSFRPVAADQVYLLDCGVGVEGGAITLETGVGGKVTLQGEKRHYTLLLSPAKAEQQMVIVGLAAEHTPGATTAVRLSLSYCEVTPMGPGT